MIMRLWMLLGITLVAMAMGKDHSQDIAVIKAFIEETIQCVNSTNFVTDIVNYVTEDAIINVAGKEVRGHAELHKLAQEFEDKKFIILSYSEPLVFVSGHTANAFVTGVEFIDGAEEYFFETYDLVKLNGSWIMDGFTKIMNVTTKEEEEKERFDEPVQLISP